MSKMSKRSFGWLLVGVVAAVFAIGMSFLFYEPQKEKKMVPADFKISRESTGGLEGGGDGQNLRITADGKLTQKDSHKTLPEGELQRLTERLEDMGFFTLNGRYPEESQCADTFVTSLTVTLSTQTKTVIFEQCEPNDTPPKLLEFDEHLLDLAEY